MTKAPILFLVFNRPELTARVFSQIAAYKPTELLIVADGPRNREEQFKTDAVRAIIENIDWDCKVYRNYSDSNLGCRKRVSSGISWAFTQVEEAIILEDDCLPGQDFFKFCELLLAQYRNRLDVMHISGNNVQGRTQYGTGSYYFSKYPKIWGWATWRRAWNAYDPDLIDWRKTMQIQDFAHYLTNPAEADFWAATFDQIVAGSFDTWDAQWVYAVWKCHGKAIIPNANLIENIGFGQDATHTKGANPKLKNTILDLGKLALIEESEIDQGADNRDYELIFSTEKVKGPTLMSKLVNLVRRIYAHN